MKLPYVEPFKIKMVENIKKSTKKERIEWIKEAKYNLFKLSSDKVFVDLLTDSGTGAMSDEQWAELMLGDESYAGSSSFFKLKNTVTNLLGLPYFLPTHQGRAAENVLFSVLVKEGDVVPGNSHFDTTKGHIEYRKAKAIDCTIDEAFDTTVQHNFKGNIDIEKLENVFCKTPKEKIPFTLITITCNSSGGQAVSMENMKAVRKLCNKYSIRVLYDIARFAENAYFIKKREVGYENKSIKEIVKEMFLYTDGAVMSSKKDGIANMGGFIALREEEIFTEACTYNIMFEGYITYGGMSGRDMGALAQVGGHAIFIDLKRFLPNIPQSEYPAQLLAVELFIEAGIRGVEIGTLLADRDPITRENRYPKLELLRLAIPRRVYTNNHMDYVAVALKNIFERRNEIKKGLKITWEAPIMRHFTVELEKA
ncbi:MAG: tyrosine phenol-lyase [Bacteroidetes bacterium 4572_128]|nr:MAG: tyrosine phenol-lyase [Bacteroidetes bacterium 4572_128]